MDIDGYAADSLNKSNNCYCSLHQVFDVACALCSQHVTAFFLNSGMISLAVKSKTSYLVNCVVVDSGELISRRHLNVCSKSATLTSITVCHWTRHKPQLCYFLALQWENAMPLEMPLEMPL